LPVGEDLPYAQDGLRPIDGDLCCLSAGFALFPTTERRAGGVRWRKRFEGEIL
jgi:hypothetical protein